jgi:hypothetical protein
MRVLTLILLSLLVTIAPAAPAAQGSVELPQYDVELVVFLRDANPGGEYWPEPTQLPDPRRAVATVQGGEPPRPVETVASQIRSPAQTRVTALPSTALQLKPHAEALRRKGMVPLLHVAWRQPVADRDNQDWLWLDASPVQGLVRISLGRYLHIDTDLVQRVRATDAPEPLLIRATDRRRMRSGELHYLDHPGFGLLVLITPHENELPEMRPVTQP